MQVPLDGSVQEDWLTREVKARGGPEMYYIAVMDCDDDIHLLLGDSSHGRIEVRTHISDGNSEFSYEKRGILNINVLLLAVYIAIVFINFGNWRKYQERHDLWDTPHVYCIAAMLCQVLSIVFDLISNI